MANLALNRIVRHLHKVALTGDDARLSDGELLTCFLTHGDEAAFAALVHRYGPMVFGVCQRVLHNRQDAEDAFQATFLVLVRKGNSIVPRDVVGNWLYGVAFRTALEAKKAAAKRREKERKVSRTEAVHGEVPPDLTEVLDQELDKLPDKYLAHPFVLCDVQGKTRKEAARHLNCPDGTVAGNLARARQLLARRLALRGVVVSAGGLALFFSQNVASAAVPATLVASTVKAGALYAAGSALAGGAISANVAALADGVMKTMVIMKLKTLATCVLAFCFLTVGLGLVGHSSWPNAQAAVGSTTQEAPKDKPAAVKDQDEPAKKDAKKDEPKKDEAKKDSPQAFSKIHVHNVKAIIRQTGKESVTAQGDPFLAQRAKNVVKDGTLHLEGIPGVEFVVEVKDLSSLTMDGISRADIKDLKTKRLEVTIKSAAQVHVAGTADEQVINVAGVGTYNGEECKGKQAKVTVDGSGQAAVNVSDKLDVTIKGVGRVHYLGSPAVEKNVAFGGQLINGPANFGGQGGFGGGLGGLHSAEQRLGSQLETPSAYVDRSARFT